MTDNNNNDNDMTASILQMKRQALQAKKEGNIEQAKQYLEEAKLMELYAVGVEQLEDPNDLKKLAVYLKQKRNDMEGAKAALQRAQKLEQQSQEDPVQQAMEQATLDELTTNNNNNPIQFTVQEMLDVETLQDMKTMDMPIPSPEEYTAQAMDCKRQAVQAKQAGDMTAAKQHLLQSKQLEAAMERLHPSKTDEQIEEEIYSEEDNALLQELMGMANGNHVIGDDADNGALEALFDNDGNTIEVDDLDDLDADMLQDMMEAGMNIPTVEEIEQQAKEKKVLAAQFHKQQNIVAAKAALAESKRLQGKAQQLADMLQAIQLKKEQTNNTDPEAMLEALMTASEKKTSQPKTTTTTTPEPEEQLLSSAEYRAMALEFKQKKDLGQAKIALINYKKALAKEQDAAFQQQKEQVISTLETKEIPMAIQQQRLFAYYQRLVDENVGTMQYTFWQSYQQRCQDALENLKSPQTTMQILCQNSQKRTVKDSHGNPILEMTNDLSFCGTSCDSTTTGFEIAILDVAKLFQNKTLKKMMRKNKSLPLHIQVVISIALPQTEMEDSPNLDNIILDQWTKKGDSFTNTDTKSTIMVPLERGSSRYAKTLVKRMGRRRMMIQVYHVHPKPPPTTKTTFLFFSKTSVPEEPQEPPTLLGSVPVELSHFLEHNYLAGDFPLMDSSRRNEVGGSMQLAIRTCQPFDPQENEHAALLQMIPQEQVVTGLTVKFATMKPYGALSALLLEEEESSSLEQ